MCTVEDNPQFVRQWNNLLNFNILTKIFTYDLYVTALQLYSNVHSVLL
jgi:hypothetical protein